MALEYVENTVQLLANLAALLLCLFFYISSKHRSWFYAIVYFLSSLLSSYYWTSYLIIMGDWPNVSDLMTYFGWNVSYLVLFVLLMHVKSPEERRYFHPLMLLPIPLNIWQLTIYLQYGRLFNNLYQVTVCTLLSVFGIQSLCWYMKHRKNGLRLPWVPLAVFLIAVFEFGMWTSSCMYEPFSILYYPFSILCSSCYLFLTWSIRQRYNAGEMVSRITFDRKYQNILKITSLGVVLIFSIGGILLGTWMRNVMMQHMEKAAVTDEIYDIIPIVLFIISLVLIAFVIAVIVVVYFAQHAAENNKLREARQIADRSNAAKSEFLANMSHEIRTPINAVMGMNEIILRESRQASARLPEDSGTIRRIFADISSYSGTIDSAGKNLLAIINDILDISRIEAGKMEIRDNSYMLSSVLTDVCALIRFRAQSRGLAFYVNVNEQLPDHLYGDALRVRQVLMNILGNAVKYTNKGSVTLSVFTDMEKIPESGQNINLVFSVKDTGIGIRKENLDKLFEKFERIGLDEHANVEGTGLGLTITRNLLDMMHGTIRVESVYGEGSLFTVSVPQKIVSREPVGCFMDRLTGSTDTADKPLELFRAPDARILVVDDMHMNLTVVESLLKSTEIQIDTADSGESALEHTLSSHYDLILMDQRMPGMDGTETLFRIRTQDHGSNQKTPVICLTADAISGAKEKYLDQGFSDYLSKPIDSQILRKKLLAFLPPDKAIFLPDGTGKNNTVQSTPFPAADEHFAALQVEGIDVEQGLRYCRHDETLYRSLLSEFADGASENRNRLEQYYTSCNWKDYGILVHSIKSASATIGALRLSETAAAMESAALNEDLQELSNGHSLLCSLYLWIADVVRPFGTGLDSSLPESDAIMEFMPE